MADVFDDAPLPMPNPLYVPVFALGDAIEPFLSNTRPLRSVAIHVNEGARDNILELYGAEPKDAEYAIWRSLISPAIFSYETLKREKVPVGFVTDPQLSAHELDGYDVLVLPSNDLTAEQSHALEFFEAKGGTVLRLEDQDWSIAESRATSAPELVALINEVITAVPITAEYSEDHTLTHHYFVRHEADGHDTLIVAVADADPWLTADDLTDGEKTDYVPTDLSDFRIVLPGIDSSQISNVQSLRFVNDSQTWQVDDLTNAIRSEVGQSIIDVDAATVGATKHLRLVAIELNTNLINL